MGVLTQNKLSQSEVRKRLNFSLLYFALTLQPTLSSKGGGVLGHELDACTLNEIRVEKMNQYE
jgi:hypothetical protein